MNWCSRYNSLLLAKSDDKIAGSFNERAWNGSIRCWDCAHKGKRRWRGTCWAIVRDEKYGRRINCSQCGKSLGKVLTHREAYRREMVKGLRAWEKRIKSDEARKAN